MPSALEPLRAGSRSPEQGAVSGGRHNVRRGWEASDHGSGLRPGEAPTAWTHCDY